jgi:hypothetical protein
MVMQSSGSKAKRSKKAAEQASAEVVTPMAASEEAPKAARKPPAKKTPAAAKQHRGSAKKAASTKSERNVVEPEQPTVTVPTGRMTAELAGSSNVSIVPEASAAVQETSPLQESPISSTGAAVAMAPVPTEQPEITHADVALLAYSYWVERGYQGGSPEEDWTRAEAELHSRR